MRFKLIHLFKYLKVKKRVKDFPEITNDEITKIRIALVDFHRKFEALNKENIKIELDYLLEKFNLKIIEDFNKNEEFFDISESNETKLLRPAYIDNNGLIYLKGIAQISQEEE